MWECPLHSESDGDKLPSSLFFCTYRNICNKFVCISCSFWQLMVILPVVMFTICSLHFWRLASLCIFETLILLMRCNYIITILLKNEQYTYTVVFFSSANVISFNADWLKTSLRLGSGHTYTYVYMSISRDIGKLTFYGDHFKIPKRQPHGYLHKSKHWFSDSPMSFFSPKICQFANLQKLWMKIQWTWLLPHLEQCLQGSRGSLKSLKLMSPFLRP